MLNVGVDIGGTKIAGGVVAPDGTIIDRARVATPTETGALADAVADMVRALAARHDVHAVGIAAAGFIDADRAVMMHSPNIDWTNEPLRDEFERRIGRGVTLENDANAAGWAEYRFGAGRNTRNMVMITLGTGVGGAAVVDGSLLIGGTGVGAELGHMRFERNGRACGCGLHGCLEMYASGRALQFEAEQIAEEPGVGAALAAARAADGRIHGAQIAELVFDDDPGALLALDRVATALGESCGSVQAAIDPEIFVLGGGVADLGTRLLTRVVAAHATAVPGFGDRPIGTFSLASLGNDAGLIGVADLAGGRI